MISLFEHTLVISLQRRPDRWTACSAMLEAVGIHPERFLATDGSKLDPRKIAAFRRANLGLLHKHEELQKWLQGTVGCLDSHIRSLEYAQVQGWPYVYICEDDAATHPDFFGHISAHMPDVPSDWWALRLGWGMINRKHKITSSVYRILDMWCTTATLYKAEAIPVLLDIYRQRERAADVYHMQFDNLGRSYAFLPFPVTQAVSKSNIGAWSKFTESRRNTLFPDYVYWDKP